jgi:hypothetical protein
MIQVFDVRTPAQGCRDTTLEYPVSSVVVGVARDQDGRHTTGRDEDRAR